MTNPVDTFFGAWGMDDDTDRASAISACMTASATYADPRSGGLLAGTDAITTYVSMFSANAPGWSARVVKSDEIAGTRRVTVAFGGPGPDGSDMIQHGQYFIDFDDTRIARMVGFVGTGAPE